MGHRSFSVPLMFPSEFCGGDVTYDFTLDPATTPPEVMSTPRSPEWREVRAEWLRRNPVCAACGSRTGLSVHHITPYHVDKSRELDPGNLITLCECPSHNCHFIFGHFLRWSCWNPDVVNAANAYRGGLERSRVPRVIEHVEEDQEDVFPPHSE